MYESLASLAVPVAVLTLDSILAMPGCCMMLRACVQAPSVISSGYQALCATTFQPALL
jgi:hypothetical protein